MSPKNDLPRVLNNMEAGWTILNETFPLCVLCVLHLNDRPEISILRAALKKLQLRHQLLRSEIVQKDGKNFFKELVPAPPLNLIIEQRLRPDTWRTISEKRLNDRILKSGPLMDCCYVFDETDSRAELLVRFHHSIIDGVSARLILHEILCLSGGQALPEPANHLANPSLPPPYQSWSFFKKLVPFLKRQLVEEWQFFRHGLSVPIPATSVNSIISIELNPTLSRKLSVKIGRQGLNLNNVLLACITKAVLQHGIVAPKSGIARMISFASLRSQLLPPVSNQDMGCYISMLRLGIPVNDQLSILDLARAIRKKIIQSSRLGDIFIFSRISTFLVKAILRFQNMRLGLSGLSFIGKLDLQSTYNTIQLQRVNAYINSNRLGPVFSAFGKVLFGTIGLDFTYMPSEVDPEKAAQIAHSVKKSLEEIAAMD